MTSPVLPTKRLILRALTLDDASELEQIVSAYEVALNTLSIPHPYPEGAAAEWIASNQKNFDEGKMVNLGIFLREAGTLIGTIGLTINREHERAEPTGADLDAGPAEGAVLHPVPPGVTGERSRCRLGRALSGTLLR